MQAYLPDALRTVLALVNSSGTVTTSYSYNIFGAATSSAGTSDPNPMRYTGLISGPAMPAGLQDNNARDYSPGTGRFISADPTAQAGSGNNLYAYAGNDTVDHSDPTGLYWQLLAGCAIGGLANDLGGYLDGRKHGVGDYFAGAGRGCLSGLLMTIPGAGEGLDALEGGETAITGADTGQDLTTVGDDLSGDGTSEDGPGPDACGTAPNSFAPSTPVTLASGKTEPISKIKPGDKVLATDPATGKTSPEPVTAVIKGHKIEHLVALAIRTRVQGRWHSGTITATAGHPFYDLTRRAWITAARLHPGDHLDTLTRGIAVVIAIRSHPAREATAYNLTVGTDHTYYVTAAQAAVLVHNCPPEGGNGNILATQHGMDQLRARGFDELEIRLIQASRLEYEQADGAIAHVAEMAPDNFEVVITGERGVITAMRNLTRSELNNLARNYHWAGYP